MLTIHLRVVLNSLGSDFRKQAADEDANSARGTLCAVLGILAANQPNHAASSLNVVKRISSMEMNEMMSIFNDAQRRF